MLQRGRKSLEAVRVLPGERPSPPSSLSERESDVWRRVINSLPADYFNAAELYLLMAYCHQWAIYERVSAQLKLAEDAGTDGEGEVDGRLLSVLCEQQDRALKAFTMLATKMRLTQQSRYETKSAAVAQRRGGEKPWRRAASDE